MRTLTADCNEYLGKKVTIAGWVHRIRELGAISFVLLRDRSGIIQLVYEEKTDLTPESVIQVQGTVKANEKAPAGIEIHAEETTVLAPAESDLPFPVNSDPANIGLEAVLDNRFISLRNPKIRGIFELQAGIIQAFSEYLQSKNFTEIKTSKLIGTGTEGGTGLFTVDYFDQKVFLAQSPQFYKQAMVASGMEQVYEIGAAYRAEKHETNRHLNEYVSLDVETAFIESESDLIALEREILKHIFQSIRDKFSTVIKEWDAYVPGSDQVDSIPSLTHDEAKKQISELLKRRVFEINPEGERKLCEWAGEKHGVEAVFITAYPRKKRPFYTFPEGLKTRSFDLLFRGMEITTGGRRINRYDMMLEALPKFGLKEEDLSDYLQIFRYGCPPHGGFAIGLERLTMNILGLQNVKEASLFPRDRKRIRP